MSELRLFVEFGIFPTCEPFNREPYFWYTSSKRSADLSGDSCIMLHSLLTQLCLFSKMYQSKIQDTSSLLRIFGPHRSTLSGT